MTTLSQLQKIVFIINYPPNTWISSANDTEDLPFQLLPRVYVHASHLCRFDLVDRLRGLAWGPSIVLKTADVCAGMLATGEPLVHCWCACDFRCSSVPGTLPRREATSLWHIILLSPWHIAGSHITGYVFESLLHCWGQPAVWLRWWIPSLLLKSAGVPPVMYTALKPKTGEL